MDTVLRRWRGVVERLECLRTAVLFTDILRRLAAGEFYKLNKGYVQSNNEFQATSN